MKNFIIGVLLLSFSLSYLSGTIFPYFLGQNPIEPIIIFGGTILYRNFKSFRLAFQDVFRNKYFGLLFFYCLILFAIGFAETGVFSSVYADLRANLIFFFGLFFFSSNKWESNARVMFVIAMLWGLTVFDFMAMLIRPFIEVYSQKGLVRHNISAIVPVFLMVYYMHKGRLKYVFILVLIIGYEVVFSYMRNVYLITFIGLFLVFLITLRNFNNKRVNKTQSFLFVFVFIIIGINNFGKLIDYWEADGSRSIHSVRRTRESINDFETESVRINSFLLPFIEADKVIVPKGLGAREHIKKARKLFDYKILSTNDSSFFYLSYHYGVIFSCFFIFFFLRKPLAVLFKFFYIRNYYFCFIIGGFLTYIILMFFSKSILLSFPPAAIAFSLVYSIIIKPKDFFKI